MSNHFAKWLFHQTVLSFEEKLNLAIIFYIGLTVKANIDINVNNVNIPVFETFMMWLCLMKIPIQYLMGKKILSWVSCANIWQLSQLLSLPTLEQLKCLTTNVSILILCNLVPCMGKKCFVLTPDSRLDVEQGSSRSIQGILEYWVMRHSLSCASATNCFAH